MTRVAMFMILQISPNIRYLPRDDPFFTGIVANIANVSLLGINHKLFYLFKDALKKPVNSSTLVIHFKKADFSVKQLFLKNDSSKVCFSSLINFASI